MGEHEKSDRARAASTTSDDPTLARRTAWARWVLLASGATAALLYLAMPFVDAGPLYRIVLVPALSLPVDLDAEGLEQLSTEQQATLESFAVHDLFEQVGEPIPVEPRAGEPVVGLTPAATASGARQLIGGNVANEKLAEQTRVVGRYLLVASLLYLLVACVCIILPLIPRLGPGSHTTIVLTGACALLLLASHLMTVGFDLSGIAEEAAFTWQSHVFTLLVVIGVGIGSALPLGAHNALRCVFGTLGAFLAGAVSIVVYLAM